MRKLRVLVFAVVGCLAVGSVAVAVAKPDKQKIKKIKTKVNVGYQPGQAPSTYNPYTPYNPYDPYGTNATFSGKVKAKKDCERRRKVTITSLGRTSTSRDGQFSFTFPTNSATPGNYRVRVAGKRYSRGQGKHKKKFKCKPTEKTVTVVAARAAADKVKHVKTKVNIAYEAPGGPYTPDTGFTGKVKAKQGCDAKRTVKLSKYGKTKTSKSGSYAFGVSTTGAEPGEYKVKVLEKALAGGDIVCDPVNVTFTVG